VSTALPKWWFGPPPVLRPDERWLANHAANRTQGKRAVGGGLHFTNYRVLFTPNVLDVALGGKAWACAREDVTAIGVQPARFAFTEMFSGGLVERLRLDLRDGRFELFVVSAPAEVARSLQAVLRS
jgi:hypothetical protein